MKKEPIAATIRALSQQLPNNWPLYSFVTSNPLAGLENLRFDEAIARIRKDIGIDGYPSARFFQQARERGAIDQARLEQQLQDQNITLTVEESLLHT